MPGFVHEAASEPPRLPSFRPVFPLVAWCPLPARGIPPDDGAADSEPVATGGRQRHAALHAPSDLGSSVTLITSEDIQAKQQRTLPEVLNDVPGLNVVQTGSPGGQTSVFIRGTNSNHTKVLIDGIDVSDPSSPNNAFDFSQILASSIDRVEVLRGPASGLYGSDAIGGVINIITKTGSGPPHVYGTLEGGSFDTFNQTTGVSGSVNGFSYALDLAHFHSGDTDVTPPSLLVPGWPLNPDYYDNKTISTKLGAQLTDDLDVGTVASLCRHRSQFDHAMILLAPEAVRRATATITSCSPAPSRISCCSTGVAGSERLASLYTRPLARPFLRPERRGYRQRQRSFRRPWLGATSSTGKGNDQTDAGRDAGPRRRASDAMGSVIRR